MARSTGARPQELDPPAPGRKDSIRRPDLRPHHGKGMELHEMTHTLKDLDVMVLDCQTTGA